MKQNRVGLSLALLAGMSCCGAAWAQSPTAVQKLQLSGFVGASPVFTGLGGGKNLSVTAGADLALVPIHGLRPTLEIRGTYPADHGNVDSQKLIAGGLRVDFWLGHRLHPYGDFLFGRGEMNYGMGYYFQNYDYDLTTTYVYSPGAGLDFDLTDHFAVKADGQFQRWGGAPTSSGTVYSTVATAALVYRFDFNRHGIH
jgi:opacity protein-like surface antigen